MITQKLLKNLLHYDSVTGVFTWVNIGHPNKHLNGCIAGSLNVNGYLNITFKNKSYVAHRLAWMYVYGDWPKGEIDHIDHNKTNNAISNLRDVIPSVNKKNIRMYRKNKTGVMGVVYRKKYNRYIARINVDGREVYLGSFDNLNDAAKVRRLAEVKYGFHPNHGK